jgi:hypothetical protein
MDQSLTGNLVEVFFAMQIEFFNGVNVTAFFYKI